MFYTRKQIFFCLILLTLFFNQIKSSEEEESEIVVAKWKFHEFSIHITVMVFLLIMILLKMAYHHIPYLSSYVPESLILIIIGIIFGAVVRYGIEKQKIEGTVWQLTPELFFTYLLPPIILESAYSLYNRTFSEYLGVVLIFAVLGTIFNFLMIGFAMYGLFVAGAFGEPAIDFDLKGFLLFSSLIVAVDPVAVLAIFQDIGVELSLYYIVFGESLLNDAITVVLYDIMVAFTGKDAVTLQQIGLGIASFFTVSLGGLLIGVLFGILTCLITRIKSHLNSFILILLAYFSYIMADCVGWSGIISMIGCGLVQAAYAFHNLDKQSVTMVHKLTKVVAEITESVIFLFLGIEVVSIGLVWHTGFMLWSLVLCLIARSVVILILTAIVNIVKIDGTKISFTEQIILIYGGLRGAVAFSLSVLVPHHKLGDNGNYSRRVIITSSLFIILFTVGLMGLTMKPLVKLLKIRMQDKKELSLFGSLNNSLMDSILAGIETLIHSRGRNVVRDFFIRLDEKYIRKILQREPETYDQKLFKVYEEIALKLHYATMRPDQTDEYLKDIPESLRYRYLNIPQNNYLTNKDDMNINNYNNHNNDKNSGDFNNEVNNWTNIDYTALTHTNQLNMIENGQLNVNTINEQGTNNLNNALRNPKRPSLLPYDHKRQLNFDETLLDILRARQRVLKHNLSIRNKNKYKTFDNLAYEIDPEDKNESENGKKSTSKVIRIQDNRKPHDSQPHT